MIFLDAYVSSHPGYSKDDLARVTASQFNLQAVVNLLCIVSCLVLIPAEAGHELPYYPSFYPHKIRVEVVSPEAAATRLQQGTLQAYAGATPCFSAPPPAYVSAVSSLGAYLVLTFDGAVAQQWQPEQRCAVLQDMVSILAVGATNLCIPPLSGDTLPCGLSVPL